MHKAYSGNSFHSAKLWFSACVLYLLLCAAHTMAAQALRYIKISFPSSEGLPHGEENQNNQPQTILSFPSAVVWKVTNVKKIYRDVSGKLCIRVCRQGTEGRGEAGLAEGKHDCLSFTPCESIWTTSGTYVSNGCGLHGGKRGGDVSSYEKIVPVHFHRQCKMQHELLLLLGVVSSPLGFHTAWGDQICTAGGKREKSILAAECTWEAQLKRNYKN